MGAFSSLLPYPQGHTLFPQNARKQAPPIAIRESETADVHLLWTHLLPGIQSPPFLEPVSWKPHFDTWASTFPKTITMLSFLGINSSSNKPILYPKRQSASVSPWAQTRDLLLSSVLDILQSSAATHLYCFTIQTVPLFFWNLVMAKTSWNWVHCKHLKGQNSMLKPCMKSHTCNRSTWGRSRGRTTTNLRPNLSIEQDPVLRKKADNKPTLKSHF